jgi:hypothetical protein
MFRKLIANQTVTFIHYLGTILLIIGMPTSKVLMSLGTIVLAIAFLFGFNFASTRLALKENRLLLPIYCFFGLHLISLFWSSDFNYAFADLRIKLPLFLIPLFYAVRPIKKGQIQKLFLGLFVLTVVAISLYNFLAYKGFIGNYTYLDFREISLFGSHIRFGLMVAFAAGICIIRFNKTPFYPLAILLFCWLIFYTYYSQTVSGFIAFIIVILSLMFNYINNYSKKVSFIFSLFIVATCIFSVYAIYSLSSNHPVNKSSKKYAEFTSKGNAYFHDTISEKNNFGEPIMVNICELELQEEWSKVSSIPYYGSDLKKQNIRNTLIRFMDSKHYKKDAQHFGYLTKNEIKAIEQGIADVNDQQNGFLARINGLKFQFNNASDPNGHSMLQRFEFWKTGIQIIQKNYLLGVGAGDVQIAFNNQYLVNKTRLTKEHQLRAHNSYLTSWISFGIVGFLVFIWLNVRFFQHYFRAKELLPQIFILIVMTSFLLEDTLETQMGVTFFAFFYSFFFEKSSRSTSPLS